MNKILKAAVFFLIIFGIAYVVGSCSSTKHVNKSSTAVDSSYERN